MNRCVVRPMRAPIVALAFFLSLWLVASPRAGAQLPKRSYPNDLYYAAFRLYYEGEYRDAGSAFRQAARGGVATSQGRWIDSICYYTMMGECFYRLGELDDALEQYAAALRLAIAHEGWTARIRWPERLDVSQATLPNPPTWGASTRNRRIARIPQKMQMLQGDVDTATAAASGGLFQQRFYMTVDAQEILRCTAISLRRRRQILGPLAAHDRLHAQVSESMARMRMPPNHWARQWQKALVGVAQAAEGKLAEAVAPLQQSLSIGNTLDHGMTSLALLELGDIAMAQDRYAEAMAFYYEATFPAAQLGNFDDVAEGMTKAATAHLIAGNNSMYAPLVAAASWAHRDSEAAEATMCAYGAENALAIGNTALAEKFITQATRAIGRSDMRVGPIQARLAYAASHVQMRAGNVASSRKSLADALALQRKTGTWLFRLSLADQLAAKKQVTPRIAADLYSRLLRVPTGKDWQTDPLDALAYLTTPMENALGRWFELSLSRKELEKALWITERIRQHRFLRTQPLGGRLLSLRWVLSAPEERVAAGTLQQRQDLLNRYPAYEPLRRRAAELQAEIRRLQREENIDTSQLAQRLQELAAISASQEAILWDIAMARVDVPLIAPQVATLEQIQARLEDGERVFVFFQTNRALYAMLVRKEDYSLQSLGSPRNWRNATSMWLRSMNIIDAHRTATFEPENVDKWKDIGALITAQFAKAFPGGLKSDSKRITIVPDGFLWYLPFGALPDADGEPLLASATVRTLPMLSMIVSPRSPPREDAITVLVKGKFLPAEQEEMETAALEDLADALRPVRLLRGLKLPANLWAPEWDRLVVLADAPLGQAGLAEWSPLVVDRGRPGSHLSEWMQLPWGAPRDVILPGFHTPAEAALKTRTANGEELFLLTCSLYASGTQTLLASRWRTAAFPTVELVREFAQESNSLGAGPAWQRSAQLLWDQAIDAAVEPSVNVADDLEQLSGKHPHFWAGFFLFDLGRTSEKP